MNEFYFRFIMCNRCVDFDSFCLQWSSFDNYCEQIVIKWKILQWKYIIICNMDDRTKLFFFLMTKNENFHSKYCTPTSIYNIVNCRLWLSQAMFWWYFKSVVDYKRTQTQFEFNISGNFAYLVLIYIGLVSWLLLIHIS